MQFWLAIKPLLEKESKMRIYSLKFCKCYLGTDYTQR